MIGDSVDVTSARGSQRRSIQRFLDTVGDGSGTKDATGNYAAPTFFHIQPPVGQIYRIARLLVTIEDGSGFDADGYGAGAALTNGILVQVRGATGGVINDLTDSIPVKTNAQWAMNCYDTTLWEFGQGNELIAVRWTCTKGGQFIRLIGDRRQRLCVRLNDNFGGLVHHYFKVNGYVESVDGS